MHEQPWGRALASANMASNHLSEFLLDAKSVVSPARCGERSKSEANFCVRSAVRLRGGWVAGGRSASRNGICPLQTLLPRLFHPKAVQVASTYHPRWGNGTPATGLRRETSSWPAEPVPTSTVCIVSFAEFSVRLDYTESYAYHGFLPSSDTRNRFNW